MKIILYSNLLYLEFLNFSAKYRATDPHPHPRSSRVIPSFIPDLNKVKDLLNSGKGNT
jgi:hypothetical protein